MKQGIELANIIMENWDNRDVCELLATVLLHQFSQNKSIERSRFILRWQIGSIQSTSRPLKRRKEERKNKQDIKKKRYKNMIGAFFMKLTSKS